MITKKTKTNMKTLYDKLKPEYKQKLKEEAVNYPSLVQGITNVLKDNYFYSHLTVGQARDLISFTDFALGQLASYDLIYGDKFFIE